MADDATAYKQAALEGAFRDGLADSSLTTDNLKAFRLAARAAMLDGRTVIQMNLEGGSGAAQVNCDPSIVVTAVSNVLAEQADAVGPTGATGLDLSALRIES